MGDAKRRAIEDIRNGEMCKCGDWRSAHPNDGPCSFNDGGRGHFGAPECAQYRPRAALSTLRKAEPESDGSTGAVR